MATGLQIKATRYHYTLIRMVKTQNTATAKSWGGVEPQESLFSAGGNAN